MKPLVIVAGPIHADGIKQLESEARVIVSSEETEAGMVKVAQEASGILFRAKPLCTRSLMSALRQLKVVGRHGVGLDTIDLPAATELGIPVVHAPGSNSNSVAEHAIMLMLALAKQAVVVDRRTRLADWGKNRWQGLLEMNGKTLGIIGVGNIGRRVAKTAGPSACASSATTSTCPPTSCGTAGWSPCPTSSPCSARPTSSPATPRTRRKRTT